MMINTICFLALFSVEVISQDVSNLPTVNFKGQTIVGQYETSYRGRKYAAFEGIPYAKSPVGKLRFEEPQPLDKLPEDTFVANQSYMCMCFVPMPVLYGVRGSEDCLYAYVYAPLEKINGDENMDVVVHIHGGAFMLGAPKFQAMPDFIMDADVVYVTFNYRVGILGFLSTEDDVVPGNNGLKDQVLALKWIKDNIKYFGGNPESITLTGHSAGASSVHYHFLSPLSRGLFNRGFSQSGTALQCWALMEEPLRNAKVVADNIGCPTNSTRAMVDCMKEMDGEKVVEGIKKLFVLIDAVPFAPFAPVVEKGGETPFISDAPYKLMNEGSIYDVPWITSNTVEEGIYPVGFFALLNKLKLLDENWDDIMVHALDINNTVNEGDKTDVVEKIRKYYFRDDHLTEDNVYDLVQLFTDRIYTIDAEKALRLHAEKVNSPVYYYFYTYVMQMKSFFDKKMKKGVAHSDDTRFLFKLIGTPSHLQETDDKMASLFVNFIAEYAKTGKPKFGNVDWLPVSPSGEEIDFLHIGGPDKIVMEKKKELGPKEFWATLPIRENEKAL